MTVWYVKQKRFSNSSFENNFATLPFGTEKTVSRAGWAKDAKTIGCTSLRIVPLGQCTSCNTLRCSIHSSVS